MGDKFECLLRKFQQLKAKQTLKHQDVPLGRLSSHLHPQTVQPCRWAAVFQSPICISHLQFLFVCFVSSFSTLSFKFSVRHAETPASQKHPAVFESGRGLFFFFFLPMIPPHSRKHMHSLWAWACAWPLSLSVLCNSSLDWWPVRGVSPFLGLMHVVVEKK